MSHQCLFKWHRFAWFVHFNYWGLMNQGLCVCLLLKRLEHTCTRPTNNNQRKENPCNIQPVCWYFREDFLDYFHWAKLPVCSISSYLAYINGLSAVTLKLYWHSHLKNLTGCAYRTLKKNWINFQDLFLSVKYEPFISFRKNDFKIFLAGAHFTQLNIMINAEILTVDPLQLFKMMAHENRLIWTEWPFL